MQEGNKADVAQADLMRQVKSKLFPSSALVGALEKMIEHLPRKFIKIRLEKAQGIEVVHKEKGEFKSISDKPTFLMVADNSGISSGWYYLETALTRHSGNRTAWLEIETENDHSGTQAIAVSSNLRGSIGEVFYMPKGVSKIRWVPVAGPGFFSQSDILLHRISFAESYLRRLYRVIYDHMRFNKSSSLIAKSMFLFRSLFRVGNAYRKGVDIRINRHTPPAYNAFLKYNDALQKTELSKMKSVDFRREQKPLISLILPVDAQADGLSGVMESVRLQSYPHWEMLLVGDFSQRHAVIHDQAWSEKIKMVDTGPERNLSRNFNAALTAAEGDYIAKLEPHALLEMNALVWLAQEISEHPEAHLIYSDEDCIHENNQRFAPRFKPDWNPDLLLSTNYIGNITLWKSGMIKGLHGYRSELEEAQDYDLLLRYYKQFPDPQIRHIAKVLYHSRDYKKEATPEQGRTKISHAEATTQALEHYFAGSGVRVEKSQTHEGVHHIHYPLPEPSPLVSILIPTKDKVDILRTCIETIQSKTTYTQWEIIIVDNMSEEAQTFAYFDELRKNPQIRIISYDKPYNYPAINNLAAKFARGDVLALVNNDIEVIHGSWLSELVSQVMRPDIGVVGPKLLYPNGIVQHAGVILGIGGIAGHAHKYLEEDAAGYCSRAVAAQNLSAVTGACMLVRKSVYEQVGGMDELHLPVAFNDTDLCLKIMQIGLRNIYVAHVKLFHHESLSRGKDDTPEKMAVFKNESAFFRQKWGEILLNDPAYNRNLTLLTGDFSLRNFEAAV